MVSISRLRKNELYEHAVAAGFDKDADEVQRSDLIEFLRGTDIVDPTKVNRGPKLERGNPSITTGGQQVSVDYGLEVSDYPQITAIVEQVAETTEQHHQSGVKADIGEFWEILSLVVNACQSPDELTFDTITTFRRSAITTRFYAVCLRSAMAVMRQYPNRYSNAVQVAIVDTINSLAGDENKERRLEILEEIKAIKTINPQGITHGDEPRQSSGDSPGDGPSDESPTGDDDEIRPEDEHDNGD